MKVLLKINEIDLVLGITADMGWICFGAQLGVAKGNQTWIIASVTVDGSCAESPDKTQESHVSINLRIPAFLMNRLSLYSDLRLKICLME